MLTNLCYAIAYNLSFYIIVIVKGQGEYLYTVKNNVPQSKEKTLNFMILFS